MTTPDENHAKNKRQRLTPIHRWMKMKACLSCAARAAMFFETRVRAAPTARAIDESASELIPEADHRQNELRIPRILLQLLPQPGHMHVHGARRRSDVVTPNL